MLAYVTYFMCPPQLGGRQTTHRQFTTQNSHKGLAFNCRLWFEKSIKSIFWPHFSLGIEGWLLLCG